ncbi:unnamed protein product, partial [Amoebophrya sp. A120]
DGLVADRPHHAIPDMMVPAGGGEGSASTMATTSHESAPSEGVDQGTTGEETKQPYTFADMIQ